MSKKLPGFGGIGSNLPTFRRRVRVVEDPPELPTPPHPLESLPQELREQVQQLNGALELAGIDLISFMQTDELEFIPVSAFAPEVSWQVDLGETVVRGVPCKLFLKLTNEPEGLTAVVKITAVDERDRLHLRIPGAFIDADKPMQLGVSSQGPGNPITAGVGTMGGRQRVILDYTITGDGEFAVESVVDVTFEVQPNSTDVSTVFLNFNEDELLSLSAEKVVEMSEASLKSAKHKPHYLFRVIKREEEDFLKIYIAAADAEAIDTVNNRIAYSALLGSDRTLQEAIQARRKELRVVKVSESRGTELVGVGVFDSMGDARAAGFQVLDESMPAAAAVQELSRATELNQTLLVIIGEYKKKKGAKTLAQSGLVYRHDPTGSPAYTWAIVTGSDLDNMNYLKVENGKVKVGKVKSGSESAPGVKLFDVMEFPNQTPEPLNLTHIPTRDEYLLQNGLADPKTPGWIDASKDVNLLTTEEIKKDGQLFELLKSILNRAVANDDISEFFADRGSQIVFNAFRQSAQDPLLVFIGLDSLQLYFTLTVKGKLLLRLEQGSPLLKEVLCERLYAEYSEEPLEQLQISSYSSLLYSQQSRQDGQQIINNSTADAETIFIWNALHKFFADEKATPETLTDVLKRADVGFYMVLVPLRITLRLLPDSPLAEDISLYEWQQSVGDFSLPVAPVPPVSAQQGSNNGGMPSGQQPNALFERLAAEEPPVQEAETRENPAIEPPPEVVFNSEVTAANIANIQAHVSLAADVFGRWRIEPNDQTSIAIYLLMTREDRPKNLFFANNISYVVKDGVLKLSLGNSVSPAFRSEVDSMVLTLSRLAPFESNPQPSPLTIKEWELLSTAEKQGLVLNPVNDSNASAETKKSWAKISLFADKKLLNNDYLAGAKFTITPTGLGQYRLNILV